MVNTPHHGKSAHCTAVTSVVTPLYHLEQTVHHEPVEHDLHCGLGLGGVVWGGVVAREWGDIKHK